jgi:hypothetical protein
MTESAAAVISVVGEMREISWYDQQLVALLCERYTIPSYRNLKHDAKTVKVLYHHLTLIHN